MADNDISLAGPAAVGSFAAAGGQGRWVSLEGQPALGEFSAQIGIPPGQMSAAIAPCLGAFSASAAAPAQVSLSASAAIGRFLAWGGPLGSGWSALGLPLPRHSGYSYSRSPGLVRTKFRSGATRQRRQFFAGYRKLSVEVELNRGLLNKLEEFIGKYGYDWFLMPLLSSDSVNPTASMHVARIIADPNFGQISGDQIVCSLTIEVQG